MWMLETKEPESERPLGRIQKQCTGICGFLVLGLLGGLSVAGVGRRSQDRALRDQEERGTSPLGSERGNGKVIEKNRKIRRARSERCRCHAGAAGAALTGSSKTELCGDIGEG